jgi:hypothetical protein
VPKNIQKLSKKEQSVAVGISYGVTNNGMGSSIDGAIKHANNEDETDTKTDERSGMNAKELLNNNKLGTEDDPQVSISLAPPSIQTTITNDNANSKSRTNSITSITTNFKSKGGITYSCKSLGALIFNTVVGHYYQIACSIQSRSSCLPLIRRIFGIGNRKLRAHTGVINIYIG